MRTSSNVRRSLAMLSLILLACGDEAAPGDRSAPVFRDSAGITIVENTAPLLGEDAWSIGTEPAMLIGHPMTDEVIRPRSALRLADGRIVVTDEGAHQVRFFSADGALLHGSGRAGEGPGEFGYPWTIATFRGDSLMVYDYALRRVSILDADGAFGRSFPVTFGPNYWPRGVLEDSLIFLASPGEGRQRPGVTGVHWDSTWFVLYRGPDVRIDTVGRYALSEQPGFGGTTRRPRHFGHRMVFALTGDGFWMGPSTTWEVGRYTARGELRRLVRASHEPQPVTPELRARFREGYAEVVRAEEGDVSDDEMERALRFVDDADYPSHLPAYSAMIVDARDHLWVEEYRIHTDRVSSWRVFDAEGRWLTTVRMPDGLVVHAIGDDHVLGFVRDDVGLDRVALFALRRSGSD